MDSTADAGIKFVRTVKSTRALLRVAYGELQKLRAEDKDVIGPALGTLDYRFNHFAEAGDRLMVEKQAGEVHLFMMTIYKLQETYADES